MILVTGLDGSGKSTFLDRLELDLSAKFQILRVPTIEIQRLNANAELKSCAEFVNYLGERADREKDPSLKILAMFGAMLLFEDLTELLKSNDQRELVCERHPLIDTKVYAKVYWKVMDPKLLDEKKTVDIEKNHSKELIFLFSKLKLNVPVTEKGKMYDLLAFLYNWFSREENFEIKQLKELFGLELPTKIFFLDATASTLFSRLSNRTVAEFHEQERLLEKMRTLYLASLECLETDCEIINSETYSGTEELFLKFQNFL